jgi:hypothetical protein
MILGWAVIHYTRNFRIRICHIAREGLILGSGLYSMSLQPVTSSMKPCQVLSDS